MQLPSVFTPPPVPTGPRSGPGPSGPKFLRSNRFVTCIVDMFLFLSLFATKWLRHKFQESQQSKYVVTLRETGSKTITAQNSGMGYIILVPHTQQHQSYLMLGMLSHQEGRHPSHQRFINHYTNLKGYTKAKTWAITEVRHQRSFKVFWTHSKTSTRHYLHCPVLPRTRCKISV